MVLRHVNCPSREEKRLGLCDARETGENQPAVQTIFERDLMEKASAIPGLEPFEILMSSSEGKADLQIVNLAIKNQADLLVVGTSQHQGLKCFECGSFSSALLRYAPMSVACVPKAMEPAPAVRPCRRVLVAPTSSQMVRTPWRTPTLSSIKAAPCASPISTNLRDRAKASCSKNPRQSCGIRRPRRPPKLSTPRARSLARPRSLT